MTILEPDILHKLRVVVTYSNRGSTPVQVYSQKPRPRRRVLANLVALLTIRVILARILPLQFSKLLLGMIHFPSLLHPYLRVAPFQKKYHQISLHLIHGTFALTGVWKGQRGAEWTA